MDWWGNILFQFKFETELYLWSSKNFFEKGWFCIVYPFKFSVFFICYTPSSFLNNFIFAHLSKDALKNLSLSKKIINWSIYGPQVTVFFLIMGILFLVSISLVSAVYFMLFEFVNLHIFP
jgi:hypothetical protein